MIQPITQHLIQNIKTQAAKVKEKRAEIDEKYRQMQNVAENKGRIVDRFA